MNNASLDILGALSTVAGSSIEVAMLMLAYATIWALAWIASEQCPLPKPLRI